MPGQRIEARDRLVEDEQLGSFRDREGERQLGVLAARQLAGALLAIKAELVDAALGDGGVPVSD